MLDAFDPTRSTPDRRLTTVPMEGTDGCTTDYPTVPVLR